jgi:DNA-binding response OmpR family regulator
MSILVVDDEKDVADTIRKILEKQGYEVDHAYSAKESIDKVDKKKTKLVFLDIMLPGSNGQKIAAEMREKFGNELKIVFVSIKPVAEVDMSNVNGFVQKPFKMEEIIVQARIHAPDDKKAR